MRNMIFALLALAAAGVAAPAAAQEFVPSPGQTYLDLDSADERYSQWTMTGLCGVNALEGTMRVARVGPGLSQAMIAVLGQSTAADIAFFTESGATTLPGEWGLNGQPAGAANVSVSVNVEVPFSIYWTGTSVTFAVNGVSRTLELGEPVQQLLLQANSGETMFLFNLGRRGAAPRC